MDTVGIIALVLGIVSAIFFAIVLYYLIKYLLKPELHVKSGYDPKKATGPGQDPNSYLNSTFVMLGFERQTACDMASLVRDLRFQLSSLQCYDDLMLRLIEEHKNRVNASSTCLLSDMTSFGKDIHASCNQVANVINTLVQSSQVTKQVMSYVIDGYKEIMCIGQHIKNYMHDIFDIDSDQSAIIAYNLSIQLIMTEADRKLFIFDNLKNQESGKTNNKCNSR